MKARRAPVSTHAVVVAAALCVAMASDAPGSPPNADTSTLGAAPDEQQKKVDAAAADMKAQLQHVKEAVNAAKKPEDLDPVLFDLQKYQNGGFNNDVAPENRDLYQQLASALQFTKAWQSYLSHTASGETDQAKNDLSSISQGNYGVGLIPRSRILALMTAAPPPASNPPSGELSGPAAKNEEYWQMLVAMNTLDDLEPTRNRLNVLAANDDLARSYVQRLDPMLQVYDDLKNGLPTSININFMGGADGPGATDKIDVLLMKFILAHYFDTYKGAAPADTETPAAYVERVRADALAAQDWPLLKKALTAHAYMFRDVAGTGGVDDETAGLDNLMDAMNQEAAGQFALAIISYEKALKAGSLDIPAKFIGTRLDALKKDHPQEFAEAMQIFLVLPPLRTFPGMSPMMMREMTSQQGMPGYPGMPPYPGMPGFFPQPQPSPVLQISGSPARPSPPTAPPPAK